MNMRFLSLLLAVLVDCGRSVRVRASNASDQGTPVSDGGGILSASVPTTLPTKMALCPTLPTVSDEGCTVSAHMQQQILTQLDILFETAAIVGLPPQIFKLLTARDHHHIG